MPLDAAPPDDARHPVPWRTIWASIGAVLLTVGALFLISSVARILIWLLIALFFAVSLNPLVDILERRAHLRRGLATTGAFFAALVVLGALGFAFVRPLVREGGNFVDKAPTYLRDAERGRGPVGGIVRKYNLADKVREQRTNLRKNVSQLGRRSVKYLGTVGTAIAGTLTVLVLTFLLLLEGPSMSANAVALLPERQQLRVRRVAADCARAVTGYVAGNLFISLVAGVATAIFLLIVGVPFVGVLALWVAFADLIPLVGATIGAVVVVLVAFLQSPTVGIAAIIFFVVYQQFENHVLQPVVQSRTVHMRPLTVLVSVLLGVELAGFLGALLAIPAAGVIQVIARDVWDTRRGRPKVEPTVGEEERPVGSTEPGPGGDPDGGTDPGLGARSPA
ncbi:MAG: AI-2E family transporter [Actinobacteria bacterium]|nr:AI-2E family transporter [Actinomycetota bacterium]